MKRGLAIGLLIASMVILATGLIFLCAATSQPSRYPLAFLLLVLGGGLAVWSGLSLRRLRDLNPEHLSDRITTMVRLSGMQETSLSQVVAGLKVPDEAAQAALDLLVNKGQSRKEPRNERVIYLFPGLKESKVVRRCTYCGSEFSVKDAIKECPNCGGKVELARE